MTQIYYDSTYLMEKLKKIGHTVFSPIKERRSMTWDNKNILVFGKISEKINQK
jgi:hypothetical protein